MHLMGYQKLKQTRGVQKSEQTSSGLSGRAGREGGSD